MFQNYIQYQCRFQSFDAMIFFLDMYTLLSYLFTFYLQICLRDQDGHSEELEITLTKNSLRPI